VQSQLTESGFVLPIVFITAYPDVETVLRAMKQGAVDVLSKPISSNVLLDTLAQVLESDAKYREEAYRRQVLLARVATLTAREYEVMGLIIQGNLNKQICHLLNIKPNTVELHRSKIMGKMRVRNTTELMRIVLLNDLLPEAVIGKGKTV
jgi:FixJ family two-component response regulator